MFKKLLRFFSHSIALSSEPDTLVYFYPVRHKKLKVNATIDVPDNFQAVVLNGGKITDIISTGHHKINASVMPGIFQKLKLGRPTKKGNYKKRFKAEIIYVKINQFMPVTFSSDNPFYLRSDKFGRVKGYAEGTAQIGVENSEALVEFLLRYSPSFKNSVLNQTVQNLIGNAVNKLLEKSPLHFSEILLTPEKLDAQLNPAVSNMVGEYGLAAKQVKLISLQLTKKMQKRVNEFLANRAGFQALSDDWSVTIEPTASAAEPQPVVKEPVAFEIAKAQPIPAPVENAVSGDFQKNTTQTDHGESGVSTTPVLNSPLINRRLKNTTLVNSSPAPNNNLVLPNLDTTGVLQNNANYKQCKYCNATIEMHHKFCPKCGFKQM